MGRFRSRRLFDERIGVGCSPGHAARFNGLALPQDFARATLLHAKYRRRERDLGAGASGRVRPAGGGIRIPPTRAR